MAVLRWVCEDLRLKMIPASTTKAVTCRDIVHTYTHKDMHRSRGCSFNSVKKFCRYHCEHIHTSSCSCQDNPVELGNKETNKLLYHPVSNLLTKVKEELAGKKWPCPRILGLCFYRWNFCLGAFFSVTWICFIEGQLALSRKCARKSNCNYDNSKS